METNTGAIRKKKRRNAAITAVILAILLLLTGTFAWQSLSQSTIGTADGETGPVGARLHDDYEYFDDDSASPDYNGKIWRGGTVANKDIYVENYEDAEKGRDAFVRVRMYEYMEMGEGAMEGPGASPYTVTPLVSTTDRSDVTTWVRWRLGEINEFSTYWDYTLGGKKSYMPTFNKDKEDDKTDIKGAAKDHTVPANKTIYDLDAGLHNYFESFTSYTTVAALSDVDTDIETHTAQDTQTATVMTMSQWKAAGRNVGDFWVLDADGWAYWANALAPQTATGLLLSDITLKIEPEEEWYYAIHTRMQAVSAGNWGEPGSETGFHTAGEDPSPDAMYLLNHAAGYVPKVISMSFDTPVTFAYINTQLNLQPNVVTQYTDDPADKKVTWSISPATASFNNGAFIPSSGDAGKWFDITATSVLTPTQHASVKVYVPEAGTNLVSNEANGKLYKDMGQNCYSEIMPNGSVSPTVYCAGLNQQPGTAADFGPVFDEGGTYYYQLSTNRYQGPGADALLGTGDDEILYCTTPGDYSTLAPVTDQYVVQVSPVSATITKGEDQIFTAEVLLGTSTQSAANLTWALVGSHQSGTSLDVNTGGQVTLNIDIDETANSIILRATQPGDPGIMSSYRDIPVTFKSANPARSKTVGDTFEDENGIEWLVLEEESGHKLVMTKYAYEFGSAYNITNVWTPLETSNLRTVLNNFYKNKVGTDLKNYAVKFNPNPLTDVRTAVGGWSANESGTAGFSHPGTGSPAANGNDGVFILTITEANEYFNNDAERKAYDSVVKTAIRPWWLRSSGESTEYPVTRVTVFGSIYTSGSLATDTVRSIRPAMWIKAD